tara:strand:- start:8632 stop:9630 length:999 start_codon:yes stop_codon:yes gene_type:complete
MLSVSPESRYFSSTNDSKDNTLVPPSKPHEIFIPLLPHRNIAFKSINLIFFNLASLFMVLIKRPRIVVVHDSVSALLISFFKNILKIKLVIDFHEIIWSAGYGNITSSVFKKIESIVIKKTDFAIFSSDQRKDILLSEHDIEIANTVIPNFPDTPELKIKQKTSNDLKGIFFGAVNDITFETLYALLGSIKLSVDVYAFGSKSNLLKEKISSNSKVKVFEPFNYGDLGKVLAKYDFSICVYPGGHLNNEFCEPRKLYESLGYGLPVLINDLKGPKTNPLVNKYLINQNSISKKNILEAKQLLMKDREELISTFKKLRSKGSDDFVGWLLKKY